MKNLREPRSEKDSYHVYFSWNAKKHWHSTGTRSAKKAREVRDAVLERRRLCQSGLGDRLIPEGIEPIEWIKKGDAAQAEVHDDKEQTIDHLIREYLAARQLRVESSQLSHASFSSDKYRLDGFKTFCSARKKSLLPEVLASEFLGEYKNSMLRLLKRHKTSAINIKHRLRTVKAMLLWAYDEDLIDRLPKKLKRYADVTLPKPKPEFFSVAQVKALYEAATPQIQLWIILGLNCGFTQVDIASLTHDMIDLQKGTIRRDRQKTGVDSEHKLWPVTLRLLQEQMTDASRSRQALLTHAGHPLIREEIRPDGNPSKTDYVAHAFGALRKKVKIDLPFKCFRKTGANMLAKKYQDMPWLVTLYLSHCDPTMRKHYTSRHSDELHKATDWLGQQFSFVTGLLQT